MSVTSSFCDLLNKSRHKDLMDLSNVVSENLGDDATLLDICKFIRGKSIMIILDAYLRTDEYQEYMNTMLGLQHDMAGKQSDLAQCFSETNYVAQRIRNEIKHLSSLIEELHTGYIKEVYKRSAGYWVAILEEYI